MPLDIAISGSSGLVGSRLATDLVTAGYRVRPMVRREPRNNLEIRWNPEREEIDTDALGECTVVVHLAGENIGSGKWTEKRKATILQSRVNGTRLIASSLAKLAKKPELFISASAVNYYGTRPPDELCTEESPSGSGFLAEVARNWEAATQDARDAGIRTVNLRLGVVLSPQGGMLARLLPIFRLGLGGVVGSGRQVISWISLNEIPGIVTFLIANPQIAGPVNAVSPSPVANAEFTRTLAKVLGKPALIPTPTFPLKLAFGQMAQELLLGGVAVHPGVLLQHGYTFRQPNLVQALEAML